MTRNHEDLTGALLHHLTVTRNPSPGIDAFVTVVENAIHAEAVIAPLLEVLPAPVVVDLARTLNRHTRRIRRRQTRTAFWRGFRRGILLAYGITDATRGKRDE